MDTAREKFIQTGIDITEFENLINENLAEEAHNMMSFRDFKRGELTKGYLDIVRNAFAVAEQVSEKNPIYAEKAEILAKKYAYKYAEYLNKENAITVRCPSIMVVGGGNFPTKRKENQNKAFGKLYGEEFPKLEAMFKQLNAFLTRVPRNDTDKNSEYDLQKLGIQECSLFTVEQNIEDNRLKLFFNEKPATNIRELLKSRGWKYAPSTGAWQRQLTLNAVYALASIIEKINNNKI